MTGKHYPTIKDSIILLIVVFAVMFGIGLLMVIAGLARGMGLEAVGALLIKNPQYMGMINLIAITLAIWWGFKRTKTPFGQVFPLRLDQGSILLPIGLVMIGLAILLSDLDNLLRWVLHTPPDRNDILVQMFSSDNVWGLAFLLVIVAPFTEEFLFRGLILTGFANNYRVSKAIWVSALLFAVFHMNIYQMPGAFATGLVFAWLVVKTGSLWPALFGHALTNSLPIIADRVLHLEIPGFTYQLEGQILFQPLWLDGIGLALVGLGIWLLAPKLKESLEPVPELIRSLPSLLETVEVGERPMETAEEGEQPAIMTETGERPAKRPPVRSGNLGIVSLIIGIFSLLALVGSLALAVVTRDHYDQSMQAVVGLTIILGLLASMLGLGLGIAGVIKKQRIAPAVIGIVLNGFYMLIGIGIIILGVIIVLRNGGIT